MKITDPSEVVFDDGGLHIICAESIPFSSRMKIFGDVIVLNPEYDNPITLAEISKKYPLVYLVIYNEPLKGKIYSYQNHEEGVWEEVGETRGYA